jgi:hypothetical protein
MRSEVEARTETRDAILWDIIDAQRVCRVKIQGSNQLIVAHFPQNWEKHPVWLKPGNAVKILHTSGIRGHVELIGHGNFVPTPVAGDTFPPIAIGEDSILSGCQVIALDPAAMMVAITAGTYRISGVVYYLGGFGGSEGAIPMGIPAPMEMGDSIAMGTIMAWGVPIDPAPTTPGYFRIDLIVVGTDGAVDYVKGTESATPVVPEVPSGHVQCGSILLFNGMTAVTQIWINRPWITPKPFSLTMTIADAELIWGVEPPPPAAELTTDIQVTIFNQYGYGMVPPAETYWWYISMEFIFGNGEIDGQTPPAVVTKQGIIGQDHVHFTYERNHDAGDQSPMLKAMLVNTDIPIFVMGFIVLLNAGGAPMG